LEFCDISRVSEAITAKRMKRDPYCQRRNCSPLNVLEGRQTTLRWQKQISIHTRLLCAYLALARLFCCLLFGVASKKYMTQSERYVHPDDDLISDEKVQAKYHAEKKCDRVRKTKIKQDKIIDNMRLELMGSFGFLLADL